MEHERALLAALQRDISERLRPVCLDMPEETFQEIVRDIAAVKLKYGVESELSTSLRLELEQISSRPPDTSSDYAKEFSNEASI